MTSRLAFTATFGCRHSIQKGGRIALIVLLCIGLGCGVTASTLPSDATVARYGPLAQKLFNQWQTLLMAVANRPDDEAIRRINLFFNRRILFSENRNIWNQADYWATPLETFSKGAGDCKGYVIGKYVSLRLLGVTPDKLRLIYAKARIGGADSNLFEAHMVLAYYSAPAAEPLILDNLVDSILPASQRPDLTPIFSFNMENIRVGNVQNDNVNQLARWKQLLDKLKAEGFSF